ncbi:MAG TPA: hypothetical protein PKA41_08640 [Verrucomicrobiota bacterium]|nr:hypothetical protein [Verrucomicrobiota bacterium]
MEELLVNHRERLDGNEVELERREREMELPFAIESVSLKRTCDALDLILRGRIGAGEFQREDTTIEKAIELFADSPQAS